MVGCVTCVYIVHIYIVCTGDVSCILMITRTRTLGGLPAASAAATEDRGEAGAEDEGDDACQPNPEPGLKHD